MIKLDRKQFENPSVTVIIPFYNGAHFIERALNSILKQSILPNEIIIVNDGSKESERTFLESIKDKYKFIILNKENGGQGSARNAGVKIANSDFISFLDQDDYYLVNHIEDLVNALPQKDLNFGFVYADVCIANEKGQILEKGVTVRHLPHPKTTVIECIQKDMFILPSATLISKEAFLLVGGFDDKLMGYEDDDLFLRFFLAGLSSTFIKNLVTVWCINSQSTSFSIYMLRSRFHFFKKVCENFPDEPYRGKFYFADYIVPRFGGLFVSESMNAVIRNCTYQSEIHNMLKFYCRAIQKNKFVAKKKKLKTVVIKTVFTFFPSSIIKFLFSFFKISFLSSIFGFLLRRKKTQLPLSTAIIRREAFAKGTMQN